METISYGRWPAAALGIFLFKQCSFRTITIIFMVVMLCALLVLWRRSDELESELNVAKQFFEPSVDMRLSNRDIYSIYELVNEHRQRHGLKPLKVNPLLELSAKAKAYDMTFEGYWAHNNDEGLEPWYFIKSVNYPYKWAGENLARGYTSATDIANGWIKSKGHNENLLSEHYKEMGLGYVCDITLKGEDERTCLVVMHYGATL